MRFQVFLWGIPGRLLVAGLWVRTVSVFLSCLQVLAMGRLLHRQISLPLQEFPRHRPPQGQPLWLSHRLRLRLPLT